MSTILFVLAGVAYLGVATALGAAWASHMDDDFDHPIAYVFSLLWPITAAPAIAFIITARRRDRKRVAAEVERLLKQERAERERHMRRLERELGIGDDQ